MIKQVSSFQTSDGELFTNKLDATQHEFKITLRGLIQSNTTNNSLTIGQMVDILAKDAVSFKDAILKHQQIIRGIQSSVKNKPKSVVPL